MKKVLFSKILFALFLIGIDAATKAMALHWVPPLSGYDFPFGGVAVFEMGEVSFSLNTVVNTGIAWGLFPKFPMLLLALRLSIVGALFFYLFRRSSRAPFPLWLIAAGALGNIVDMCAYGWVIDFVHFRFFDWSFPIFNFADSCISVGALLLLFWPKSRAVPLQES